jgi:hypothetical protein
MDPGLTAPGQPSAEVREISAKLGFGEAWLQGWFREARF